MRVTFAAAEKGRNQSFQMPDEAAHSRLAVPARLPLGSCRPSLSSLFPGPALPFMPPLPPARPRESVTYRWHASNITTASVQHTGRRTPRCRNARASRDASGTKASRAANSRRTSFEPLQDCRCCTSPHAVSREKSHPFFISSRLRFARVPSPLLLASVLKRIRFRLATRPALSPYPHLTPHFCVVLLPPSRYAPGLGTCRGGGSLSFDKGARKRSSPTALCALSTGDGRRTSFFVLALSLAAEGIGRGFNSP